MSSIAQYDELSYRSIFEQRAAEQGPVDGFLNYANHFCKHNHGELHKLLTKATKAR